MFRIGLNYSIFAFVYISQNEQFVNITNNYVDISQRHNHCAW